MALHISFNVLATFLSASSVCPALATMLQVCFVQVSLLPTVTPTISSLSVSLNTTFDVANVLKVVINVRETSTNDSDDPG